MQKKICGIVGYPLKKPRSVPIWKNFFKKNNINASMKKFEVSNNKINSFVKFMKYDQNFLATAITMPYKISLIKNVKLVDEYAKYAKSINLIVKIKKKLYGYNTDVFGAIFSIKNEIKLNKLVLIIGIGGTGKAIFNYLKKKYANKKFVLITKKKFKKEKNIEVLKNLDKNILKNKMLIINCTPLGSSLKKTFVKKSPIPNNLVKYINKKSFIFDIVYSPRITMLNKYCKSHKLNYRNGLLMNTMQAKKALKIVFNK